jgi:heme-degrading monooxygenase HmoA
VKPINVSEKLKEEVSIMFVVIINFPPIKAGKDAEFQEWFSWSNKEFAKHKGFINRRLLKPLKGGSYAAVVEHESYETFMAMHTSPVHDEAGKRVGLLLDGHPTPQFYEVIVG